MGAKTEIAWTDSTWNPIRGCSMAKGSETGGCLNCYAARLNARNLPEMKSPTTGEPFARILSSGPRWTGKVELIEKALTLPLKWRKPKKIFVNSMSDLFHEALTAEQIDRVFAVMALCQQHTFQVLTKRPERMLWYATGPPKDRMRPVLWPLPNVWLGVSVEDQKTADARIPLLLQTPAAKRFVSYEPALGPVDFTHYLAMTCRAWEMGQHNPAACDGPNCPGRQVDQIIVGGESGPGARQFDIQWARTTVEQCKTAGVSCFVKQLGANPQEVAFPAGVTESESLRWQADGWTRITMDTHPGCHWRKYLRLKDRKGGDMAEWPSDLRVRELPR